MHRKEERATCLKKRKKMCREKDKEMLREKGRVMCHKKGRVRREIIVMVKATKQRTQIEALQKSIDFCCTDWYILYTIACSKLRRILETISRP